MELAGIISAWTIVILMICGFFYLVAGGKSSSGSVASNFIIALLIFIGEFFVFYQIFAKNWIECPTVCMVAGLAIIIEHSLMSKTKLLENSD